MRQVFYMCETCGNIIKYMEKFKYFFKEKFKYKNI